MEVLHLWVEFAHCFFDWRKFLGGFLGWENYFWGIESSIFGLE